MSRSFYDDPVNRREDSHSAAVKSVVMFFLLAIAIKGMLMSGFFKVDSLSGPGYKMEAPEGWIQVDEENLTIPEGESSVVAYETKEANPATGAGEAQIAVYSTKLTQATWIEDEFPSIISSFRRAGLKILDFGDLKINNQLFKWLLVDNVREDLLRLEFYTVSDGQMFYRISYTGSAAAFNRHRREFEGVKDSFKLNFSLGV